ncbi:MAG: ribosome-binding factor A [Opitutaceae bacterium]|nr:ribosome-binding factor A [Opitutaceae bacterium]
MSQRNLRVNVLIKQEISQLLHTRFQGQTVFITITDVSVSPDLRNGRVYYSVIGGGEEKLKSEKFFRQNAQEIRFQLGKRIVLKYLPLLKFIYDPSIKRGVELVDLMQQVSEDETPPEQKQE